MTPRRGWSGAVIAANGHGDDNGEDREKPCQGQGNRVLRGEASGRVGIAPEQADRVDHGANGIPLGDGA